MDFFQLVTDVGFPIAAAVAGGFFVFLTLKFILVIYSLFFISILFFIKKDFLHEILLSRFLIFINVSGLNTSQ